MVQRKQIKHKNLLYKKHKYMYIYNMKKMQFDPLLIDDMELDEFNLPLHSHTYYEIIYVMKGCGTHQINSVVLPYKCGDLFLISPEDKHIFNFHKRSRLIFIKFTDYYFQDNKHLSPDAYIMSNPEDIMKNQLLKEEKLIFDEPCKSILKKTVENIVAYNCRLDISSSPIMFFQILSIFGLINECLLKLNIKIGNNLPDKDDLIFYIHQNIYDPSQVRIKQIADHFNISSNYFSAYFKRNFGISFREYVNDYRLKLVEKRLESGQNTLKQIAYELGFTDVSHLSHFFKSKKKISPNLFKNNPQTELV